VVIGVAVLAAACPVALLVLNDPRTWRAWVTALVTLMLACVAADSSVELLLCRRRDGLPAQQT
jgi:hypothetical protein